MNEIRNQRFLFSLPFNGGSTNATFPEDKCGVPTITNSGYLRLGDAIKVKRLPIEICGETTEKNRNGEKTLNGSESKA